MSNTPETDAKASPHIGFFSCATVPAEFARQLERERDEARDCGQEGVCATPPGCQRHWEERNRELVRERDEAREKATRAWEENLRLDAENRRLERERDEARKAAQEWRKLYFLQWSIAYDQPLPPDGKPPFPWEAAK